MLSKIMAIQSVGCAIYWGLELDMKIEIWKDKLGFILADTHMWEYHDLLNFDFY